MFELDEGIAIKLGAIAVGIVLGGILLLIRLWRNVASMPAPERRQDLLSELQRRKKQGASFREQLQFLKREGLPADVAEGLICDSERKETAKIDQPSCDQRGPYEFQYPANWQLRPLDEAFNPDRFFCIESLSSAMVTVMVLDRDKVADVDLAESLREATNAFSKVESRPISQWGSFHGRGLAYTGEVNRCPLSGVVFVSSSQGDFGGVQVLSVCLDEDIEDAGPSLKLIEDSFQLQRKAA